jgi:diamine N-acetyltransferase
MITSARLLLRALEPVDAELLYRWENQMELWHVSNTLVPFSRYQIKKYIEQSSLDLYQTKQLRLKIDSLEGPTPESVGMIDLFDFDPFHNRAGVGIMIHKPRQKEGYAREALALFLGYAFNHLGLHQIYCNIPQSNVPSIHLFEALDFFLVGEKREWLKTADGYEDERMYQKINPAKRSNQKI